MNYSHLELARMHIDALYVHDANNRLLRINEPDPDGPAPRFFMFRTTAGNLWRTRYDLPADLAADFLAPPFAEDFLAEDFFADFFEPPFFADFFEPPFFDDFFADFLEAMFPSPSFCGFRLPPKRIR